MAGQDFAQYPNVITPNADFFVRNHFAQPSIDISHWGLRVEGAVQHPRTFAYSDLQSMRHGSLTAAIECAGNGVGEGSVGCAAWSGPMLSDLLRQCGLKDTGRYVRFAAADCGTEPDSEGKICYARSMALDKAMGPETLLALQMNGAKLPPENGYPVRVLRGGYYGMDSVKWLEKIEVLEAPDDSFFMSRRYRRVLATTDTHTDDHVGAIQIKSIIVQPVEAAVIRGTTVDIGGYAWAGQEPISRVEVTVDGGKSWQASQLLTLSPPLGWVPWRFLWKRAPPGVQSVTVRAFGESEAAQPSRRNRERLDKYELHHYHQVTFRVIA